MHDDNIIFRKVNNSKNYIYYTINNKHINDKLVLDKIKKIYIPPAYIDVKIYLDQDVLATGIDIAGRKQYVYSENSKKKRELRKYCQLVKLGKNISKLKKKINDDLLLKTLSHNKIIALILKIMDLCNFRGGNKKYEERYGSYGLTTLHKKHIIIKDDHVEIDFVGKKGINNNCIIKNEHIQDIIKKVYKTATLRDPYIFKNISMYDLNKYLDQFDITSKDLRTWNANIIFLKNLKTEIINIDDNKYISLKIKKKVIREAIKKTAVLLHHTPSICKSSYIYKNIITYIEENDKIMDELLNPNVHFEKLLKYILSKNNYHKNC